MWMMHVGFCAAGLAAAALLFHRFLFLPQSAKIPQRNISVIIPARNEAHTLPLLLSDLSLQTYRPLEILCVDDASEDQTSEIARQHGVAVYTLSEKPAHWIGKSYACQVGADHAQGELLLFLDADVRLAPDALSRLCAAHEANGRVISVQPFHKTGRRVEQLALFFNMIVVGAMTDAVPGHAASGLYGPAILISQEAYQAAGGHAAISGDVLDDLALGEKLDACRVPYQRYLGGDAVAFRMYPKGLREITQGFTKNFASGAMRIPWPVLLLAILWITALTRTAIELVAWMFAPASGPGLLFLALYAGLSMQLWWKARQIGNFSAVTCVLYPLPLLFFIFVFLYSLYRRVFRKSVTWKGRKVEGGGKACR